MNIAHVCTPHGFGHLTRQIALGVALQKFDVRSSFYCHHPTFVKQVLPNSITIQKTADIGIVQTHSLHIDIEATTQLLAQQNYDHQLLEWAKTLESYDLIISDIPPQIFAAAKLADIPVLGIGNFDWVWIYQQYEALSYWARKYLSWQEGHDGIQLNPGPPLNLNIKAQYQWLARTAQPCTLPPNSIVVAFGGLGMQDIEKLPSIPGITWVFAPPAPQIIRQDFFYIRDQSFPDLVESASIVLSKAGYGILAETMRSGTPQIWMHRPMFPESTYLEAYAKSQGTIILYDAWGTTQWIQALQVAIHTLCKQKNTCQPLDNQRLAQWIMQNYS